MAYKRRHTGPVAEIRRATIEIAFILFLFYANLMMGEFTKSNAVGKTLAMALRDVLTWQNLAVGLCTATVGYFFFEKLRRRL